MAGPATHDYRKQSLGFGREIRAFEALAPGRYAVEGVGAGIEVGDRLRFTLKGSSSLELELEVREVRYKIIPEQSWRAVLVGEDFESLDIHRWSIVCDGCGGTEPFEFSAPSGADRGLLERAATARMGSLGWQLQGDVHRCPSCAEEESS